MHGNEVRGNHEAEQKLKAEREKGRQRRRGNERKITAL